MPTKAHLELQNKILREELAEERRNKPISQSDMDEVWEQQRIAQAHVQDLKQRLHKQTKNLEDCHNALTQSYDDQERLREKHALSLAFIKDLLDQP